MADDAFYAWAPIIVGVEDKLSTIPVGDKVTPKDLGTDSDGFQEYVNSGAVRPYPYPDMPKTANPSSPLDFMRNEITKGQEDEEARLQAAMNPDIVRAQQGPVGTTEALPVPEEVETATGPPKK
jgi:hypothetical protein